MNDIILYTIGCPMCQVLKKKLDMKNIQFKEINDIDIMKNKGISSVPVLEINGELMNFSDANKWVNEQ